MTDNNFHIRGLNQQAVAAARSRYGANSRVIRDGVVTDLGSEELVVGDSLIIEEGMAIVADGNIVHSNDFFVNESILTGESLPVFKDQSAINTREDLR